MPFDGNGNWTSNFSAEADRDAGYKILASRFDNIFIADIAAGFSNCVTRDGQGAMLTNTNANNYRVINVADPVADKDAVNKQTLDTTLALLYPIGSIYIGTQETCPLTALISGSVWEQVEGRYLLASGTLNGTEEEYAATDEVDAGLPDHKHHYAQAKSDSGFGYAGVGNFGNWDLETRFVKEDFPDSIYGESNTVRPPAYVVNVWRRTA